MNDPRRESAPDWLKTVKQAAASDTVAFASLRRHDHVQVRTQNTLYEFDWEGDGWAALRTDRADRPGGRVRLMGCAFGAGSVIAPDRLGKGGRLTFTSDAGARVHRTTAILWIRLVRRLG